jgi:hypothetical protein
MALTRFRWYTLGSTVNTPSVTVWTRYAMRSGMLSPHCDTADLVIPKARAVAAGEPKCVITSVLSMPGMV